MTTGARRPRTKTAREAKTPLPQGLLPRELTPALAAEHTRASHLELFVCGLNHVRAPLELREYFALTPEACAALAREITQIATQDALGDAHETHAAQRGQALVVSTCNRTEVYAYSARPRFAQELRERFLAIAGARGSDAATVPPPPIYEYRSLEAARHLFAVASGLDSLILGENQIKQQLLRAFEQCRAAGASGPELHRLVEACFRSSKRIRSETELNVGTMCVARAAVMRGEQALGSLAGRTCLVIGAGKVGGIAARAIAERGPARLWIINRTPQKAHAMAAELIGELSAGDGQASSGLAPAGAIEGFGLDALPHLLPQADFILGAAHAPGLALDAATFSAWRDAHDENRDDAPGGSTPSRALVCIVDAAVPRLFDADLGKVEGVRLWDIEHMEEIVEENRRRRAAAADEAWAIVEKEIETYRTALQRAALAPLVRRVQKHIDEMLRAQIANLEAQGDMQAAESLRAARHRTGKKLLHEIIEELRSALDMQ